MSRIGKKPVSIPAGVQVKINGSEVTVKGPKGELKRTFVESISCGSGRGRAQGDPTG